jgi:hypothetical protein
MWTGVGAGKAKIFGVLLLLFPLHGREIEVEKTKKQANSMLLSCECKPSVDTIFIATGAGL